ncbi:potassium voltage-gated channel subfamily KQT member 5-like [Oppia nitens]|uniref:potassium voltage-gated channel subfamily KQT member 5-like n=1 Tax=Oppia nitens TaxID=1686743 RepID=UPI0023DBF6F4|nr:potassium voltage-gated channel subfamily KQT member 5-like [Oppia nitens]
MLNRVQRELSSVHPLSLYRKQNHIPVPTTPTTTQQSTGAHGLAHSKPSVYANGYALPAVIGSSSGGGGQQSAETTTIGSSSGGGGGGGGSVGTGSNKRRISKIISEVKERREMRERKRSDLQDMNGSDTELDVFLDPRLAAKTKYYKEKLKVYNFLNNPQSFWARSYHILVFILVFAGLIVTVFSNIATTKNNNNNINNNNNNINTKSLPSLGKFASSAWKFIYLFEKFIIIWFSFEFILRVWSSSCKPKYEGWRGKLRYLSVPAHILDIIIIVSSILIVTPFHTRNGSEVFAVSAFRGFHRFFSVLQIVTLNRQLQPWKVLSSVIYDQREQLLIIFYIEFIVLCILAYISYIVEKDENEQFDNIAEAMWWAVVTLATVGYGDRVPVTWLGKLVSSVFTVLGVAIFALPAGIIGAGLALKIEEEERNRQRRKKKAAAATLIQCSWRCYKASQAYQEMSGFFGHKPTDIYKFYYFETIEKKFICLTRFFIAKQRFIDLLRPLDIKSIIESYKYGQLDVMSRVSHMQNTIDTIGTRVGLNENTIQNSQSVLNQKIDSMNDLIDDINRKLTEQLSVIDQLSGHHVFDQRFYDCMDSITKNTCNECKRSCV